MDLGLATVVLTLAVQGSVLAAAPRPGLALDGEEAEHFLANADVVSVATISSGVTRPMKVELNDGQRSCFAAFKIVDEQAMRQRFADGTVELHFSDSWEYEIAAWELDKLLGTGLVPPAVKRQIGRNVGALSLWVDGAITEVERLEVTKERAPDTQAWNRQVQTVRLFWQLIYDTDYRNAKNLLVTPEWKVYKIDASRAFRTRSDLLEDVALERFSRRVLAALAELDRETLEARLGRWLDRQQIEALWKRRALILELAERRTSELGEDATLFD
jgi:hypothetical protein